jgi:hypothetical protein
MTNEIMKKKVQFFYEKHVAVHIKKKNGYIHNGLIVEFAGDLIILDDERSGAMPIYFEEIEEIEQRRERE